MVMADMPYGESKMTLIDIINKLDSFDGDDTIYVKRPWKPESAAIVATEPDTGGIPPGAEKIDAEYFLEIFLAAEFLEGWLLNGAQKPSTEEQCFRLIQYAENDA
ncbi:hypothetical protein ABW48_26535 [Pluralibacter gergoviae]|nr:hypothetical protein ABW48_26535 [Pluralibacter gergoviae]